MSSEEWHTEQSRRRNMGLVLAGVFFLLLLVFIQWCTNAKAVGKCESLKKQGVKAYIVEVFLTKECVVLQRDLSIDVN